MSNVFKRPMFRKGGDVGGGIMDNVVERRQYAKSNAEDFSTIKERIDLIESLGGSDKGLADPLTQFLLQLGPSIAGQTGGGSTIGNVLLASKEPAANLFKTIGDRRRARQAIGLEVFKDMDDDDATQFIRKAKQIAADTGRDYSDVLNELYQTEIFRKKKDPDTQALESKEDVIDSIISVTSNMYGTPSIDKMQGELIYEDIIRFKEQNPDAYSDFMRIKGKDKFIFGTGQYEGSLSDGAAIIKDSKLSTAPEGIPIYDISSGKFIVRQGNIVKEYVSRTVEE
tara:strand:- start:1654 stop:2502 length:849 start_codon:yes stop_codon:yes gene_type:complete